MGNGTNLLKKLYDRSSYLKDFAAKQRSGKNTVRKDCKSGFVFPSSVALPDSVVERSSPVGSQIATRCRYQAVCIFPACRSRYRLVLYSDPCSPSALRNFPQVYRRYRLACWSDTARIVTAECLLIAVVRCSVAVVACTSAETSGRQVWLRTGCEGS